MVGEVELLQVFGYDDGLGRKNLAAFSAKSMQCGFVFGGFGVGWVEEDEVGGAPGGGEALEGSGGGAGFERVASSDSQRRQVGADGSQRGFGAFYKDGFRRASAEGLDADGSGACVEVEENGAGDSRGEHIEEGLAKAIAGGAGIAAFGRGQRAGAKLSGDDAHAPSYQDAPLQ